MLWSWEGFVERSGWSLGPGPPLQPWSPHHARTRALPPLLWRRYAAQEWAARSEGRKVEVAESFDISELANSVYEHNFGHPTSTKSIEHLSADYIDSLGVDTWLMSPPCQPYTSQGLQQDDQVLATSALADAPMILGRYASLSKVSSAPSLHFCCLHDHSERGESAELCDPRRTLGPGRFCTSARCSLR